MEITPEFQKIIAAVVAKRPRTVLDHILKHGFITTDELKQLYGYNHPPRAARDVRECGIPLETIRVKGNDGRTIAAYKLGAFADVQSGRTGGRKGLPKALKLALLARDGNRCALCGARYPPGALQVDHRIPYEVAGEGPEIHTPGQFMLVCGSCNRAKSWSCELCPNWSTIKDPSSCSSCYWGNPVEFSHIALIERRMLTLVWENIEVADFERLKDAAARANVDISQFVKTILKKDV